MYPFRTFYFSVVYCLIWSVLLFSFVLFYWTLLWNRAETSQQTASGKAFWSGKLSDSKWTNYARRTTLTAQRAAQTCLQYPLMETVSTTDSRVQQGTVCALTVHYFESNCCELKIIWIFKVNMYLFYLDRRKKPSLMACSSQMMMMSQDSWTMSIPQPVM